MVLGAVLPCLSGCDDSLARVRRDGRIRLGYAVEAPFAFLQPGGELAGESPELARLVVGRLGLGQAQFVATEFEALIPGLEAGRFDVIAAGMFATPERERRVAFSLPTVRVAQGLLVGRGNPLRLHSYEQAAADRGARVATLGASVEEELLRGLGMSEPRLVVVPDARTGRVAVESGLADALALSAPSIQWDAAHGGLGNLEQAAPFQQPRSPARLGYVAFAFRKDDRKLLEAWNRALRSLVGGQQHRAILERLGGDAFEIPEAAP